MKWGLSHFVFDQRSIENLLLEHQNIGAHTDIVQFQSGKTHTFRWTHEGARPLGFGINPQCKECKRLKTKSSKHPQGQPKIDHSQICIRCSACQFEEVFTFPDGWKWVHQAASKRDERGAWIVRTEKRAIEVI